MLRALVCLLPANFATRVSASPLHPPIILDFLEPAPPKPDVTQHTGFDAVLQFRDRVSSYIANGHPIDKIEILVLGGTWSEYPEGYQVQTRQPLARILRKTLILVCCCTHGRFEFFFFLQAASDAETHAVPHSVFSCAVGGSLKG